HVAFDTRLQLGLAELNGCSGCLPGAFGGVPGGICVGGRRIKVGPRITTGAIREGSNPSDLVLNRTPVAVLFTHTWCVGSAAAAIPRSANRRTGHHVFSECTAVRNTSWRTNLPGRADQAAVNPVCSHALKVTLRMKYVFNSILSCSLLTTLSTASVAEAVQSPTCGWDEPHSTDSRSTVWSQLSAVDRSHTYTYELELLRRWHQECDATAGRVATQ